MWCLGPTSKSPEGLLLWGTIRDGTMLALVLQWGGQGCGRCRQHSTRSRARSQPPSSPKASGPASAENRIVTVDLFRSTTGHLASAAHQLPAKLCSSELSILHQQWLLQAFIFFQSPFLTVTLPVIKMSLEKFLPQMITLFLS